MHKAHILQLPNEVIQEVFRYLSPADLLQLGTVCKSLRVNALAHGLWHDRLTYSLTRRWTAIQAPPLAYEALRSFSWSGRGGSTSRLSEWHPRDLYLFLSQFVPQSQLLQSHDVNVKEPLECRTEVEQIGIPGLLRRLMQHFSFARKAEPPRFVILGSGADTHRTNLLFHTMLDNRNRSFETLRMNSLATFIPFSFTLRLPAEAQLSILRTEFNRAASCTNREISRHKLAQFFGQPVPDEANPWASQMTGFEFEFMHLFASKYERNHSTMQAERVASSQLFEAQEGADDLELQPTAELRSLMASVQGIIYAIDARNSEEDLRILRRELDAVIGCAVEGAHGTLPVLLMYIMPKEAVQATLSPDDLVAYRTNECFGSDLLTNAWHGSFLAPLSGMRLFELETPWRLQKCASSDSRALEKGLMWLRSKLSPTQPGCHSCDV